MNDTRKVHEEPPPFWEWVVAGVGLVLLLASIGYLAYHAIARPHIAPVPVIELAGVQEQRGRFVALVRVSNRGTLAAEKLVVSGRLKRGGETVEEAETEFEHLPGESSREAGLFFSRDPRAFQLELAARSYLKP
jgi:uncharacterized protein (TIGR02588 family)